MMNNCEIADRIVNLRKSLGLTQKHLGEKIGRSINTITNWEKGHTPFPKEMASVFADMLNVSSEWLLFGRGEMFDHEEIPQDTVEVEILTLAGLGNLYDLQNHEPIEVAEIDKDLIINVGRKTGTAVCCQGDSMYPTICDGALVGIDLSDREPVDNGIFLLHFRDLGLAIKRLQLRTDGYLIVADNPTVENELIPRERLEEGLIVGRVRWILNEV